MARVRLQSLHKKYGTIEVLQGVDLNINDGEFVVIVGPSGCGKSTLLRLVAGLETASAGEIYIGEHRVNTMEPAQRDIAMVFQNYALYPHMSVRQNMSYGLRIRGVPRAQIESRINAVAQILGLEGLLDRYPRQLSGGQRQRVAMGRAIVREPAVFLFDEPLSNLDAKLRVQMRLELEQLHQRLQTTSLYVTHDQVEAMTLADRMVVLKDGHVEQIGTPTEVYTHPANLFVAGFIGLPPMNLIRVRRSKEGLLLANTDTRLNTTQPDEQLPQEFILGIRPEHIQTHTSGQTGCQAHINVIENLGADAFAYCTLEDGQDVTVRLDGDKLIHKPGEVLTLSIPAEQTHCFEAKTGLRLNSSIKHIDQRNEKQVVLA